MAYNNRSRKLSSVQCSLCDHPLMVRELEEFHSMADEPLHSEVLCRACMEAHLVLCRECSVRYTADGLCESCAGRAYGVAC